MTAARSSDVELILLGLLWGATWLYMALVGPPTRQRRSHTCDPGHRDGAGSLGGGLNATPGAIFQPSPSSDKKLSQRVVSA
jgi:hypothetical protein